MRTGHYSLQTKVRIFIDPKEVRLEIALLAAAALAEAWLARREARWPGLLLPGVFFLRALAKAVLFYAACEPSGMALGSAVLEFVLYNVSTALLLAVCAACRECRKRKRRKARELDRMHIDDL